MEPCGQATVSTARARVEQAGGTGKQSWGSRFGGIVGPKADGAGTRVGKAAPGLEGIKDGDGSSQWCRG
jgi:hypothetical protein